MDQYTKRRVCVLVKAYPQLSEKYQETVCVAAVTEDHKLLRLYPIRYRHLSPDQQFDRFDVIEAEITREHSDPRPESYRVKEDTIRIVIPRTKLKLADRVRLWKPSVVPSLVTLQELEKTTKRSLGIVRPDPESVRFTFEPIARANEDDKDTAASVYRQQSLLEQSLHPLSRPEYVFRYQFTSGGKQHSMQIHDWEVEATYHSYKRKYGADALAKMVEVYQQSMPAMNLHLILGTMHKRPWQFIIIGVLRTKADVEHADSQADLF